MLPFAAILLIGVAPPAPPTVTKAEPTPDLDARFQRAEGWVGGDGAYSVAGSDNRTLWLFSDTWVGSVRNGKRRDVVLVNNTVGVEEGRGSEARLTFSFGRTENGKAKALFAPPDGKGWFWLYAGAQADDKLHVFLPRFEKTNEPGAFGFRALDLWLGTVSNPDEVPTNWKATYAKVPFAEFTKERKRSFGSAVLRARDQLYVYGYEEKPGKPFPSRKLLVARVPAEKLAEFSAWQFLADGNWSPEVAKAAPSADGLATEFSVTYLPGLKQYALVYTDNGLSDKIVGRFSPTPEGPWSDPVLLYRSPEMKQNKKLFTYAAKAHPHLSGENELVISYVVNAHDLGTVLDDATLYWPRFVRVGVK
jgi:hypothetical protein